MSKEQVRLEFLARYLVVHRQPTCERVLSNFFLDVRFWEGQARGQTRRGHFNRVRDPCELCVMHLEKGAFRAAVCMHSRFDLDLV